MEVADKGIALIKEIAEKLSDQNQKEFFDKTAEALTVAKEYATTEEKEARLLDAVIKYANQSAFILFRQNEMTDEIAAKLRELPTPEDTSAQVKTFNDARQEKIDAVNEQHREIYEEEKDLDIFTGIIAGMTKEQAEKRMAEHEAQIREASANR